MTLMLASVATAAEAELAYACGADWIDIKDPRAGALGAATPAIVRSIVEAIGGRAPVSATIGDCWEQPRVIPGRVSAMAACGVDYVKAGLNARAVAREALEAVAHATRTDTALIIVCMAESPPQAHDVAALAACGIRGIMLDTANKSGARLTGLLAPRELHGFVAQARELGLLSGLAGRLTREDIATAVAAESDYLGFRSALCDAAERRRGLSRARILDVRAALSEAVRVHSEQRNEVA